LGLVILSALRNAAKNAAFVLAAVAAKNAALEYRNDAPWNTKPEALMRTYVCPERSERVLVPGVKRTGKKLRGV
jgi:hypothetical protein